MSDVVLGTVENCSNNDRATTFYRQKPNSRLVPPKKPDPRVNIGPQCPDIRRTDETIDFATQFTDPFSGTLQSLVRRVSEFDNLPEPRRNADDHSLMQRAMSGSPPVLISLSPKG
ncbi:hypothetical protein I6F11_07090 [Ensifer sp. NBAIM29]|nr:hypothetical protein [Ensifer sp. NBAIM29]